MIRLEGIRKSFGDRLLFEGVDWLIGPRDRIGLVGPNGSGKSTLLRILAGLEAPDAGAVIRPKSITLGYLPQWGLEFSGRTVFEECLSVFEDLRQMEVELARLTRRLSELDPSSQEYEQAARRFHQLETEFRTRSGYALEARVGAVLEGLGFSPKDWHRPTSQFSGGWQMRIALARLLLQQPELLLLDEPTNHLDLDARNWFEEYLKSYPHAFVVVSHDRLLLDTAVEKIAEISHRQLFLYPGNYSRYVEQRQRRREQLEAQWRHQQQKIQQLETFIERFRYKASKARQVQSRIKELERMERIELPPEEETIHFAFPQPPPSGRLVATLENVTKCYGDLVVLENVTLAIERGDRIALVGPNGAGKSTLLKLLAGLEPASSGRVTLGYRVEPSYFAQDQYRELPAEATLLDDLASAAPTWTLTQIRTLLGCFLFRDDDVYKRIGVLSGGERSRYALARLLVSPSNFLLLDEPTNHLDLRAKEVLLDALRQYTGTVVFVSHDRYFIDQLATKIYEIGNRTVHIYLGNYEDYLYARQQRQILVPGEGAEAPESGKPASGGTVAAQPQATRPRRVNPLALQRMKQECEALEQRIAALEQEIQQTEFALAQFVSAERSRQLARLLDEQRAELEALLAQWEQLATRISEAETQG